MVGHGIAVLTDDQLLLVKRDNRIGVGETALDASIGHSVENQLVADLFPSLVLPEARVDGHDIAVFEQSEAHIANKTALSGRFNPSSNDRRT